MKSPSVCVFGNGGVILDKLLESISTLFLDVFRVADAQAGTRER